MTEVGFYALSLIMIMVTGSIITQNSSGPKVFKALATIFILWLLYLVALSLSGFLNSLSLPPRVPLMILLPAFVLIFLLTSRASFKNVLKQTPLHFVVYIQSFRIVVELLIYGAFVNGLFPQRVTFEGLNYDILVGISALPVGYLVQKQKLGKSGLLIWNIVALLVLSLTAYAFISSFYFSDFVNEVGEIYLVKLPYLLLPGVLLPFAIFYHVISIKQCLMK